MVPDLKAPPPVVPSSKSLSTLQFWILATVAFAAILLTGIYVS